MYLFIDAVTDLVEAKTSRKNAEGKTVQVGKYTGIYTCNSLISLLPSKGVLLSCELPSFIY